MIATQEKLHVGDPVFRQDNPGRIGVIQEFGRGPMGTDCVVKWNSGAYSWEVSWQLIKE